MEISDLRVFEAVARIGTMNGAAGELNTVQSNVTARIRLLEDDLAAQLFERHSRGVKLTAAGKRLMPFAEAALRLVTEARRATRDEGVPQGPLTIGTLETTAAIHLSPVLTEFAKANPEVALTIRAGTTEELLDHVLAGRLEGAFVCGPVDHPELVSGVAFEEELVLITASAVDLEQALHDCPVKVIVLRAGCSYRQRLETILTARGAMDLQVSEFGTIETIIGCVAAGLGMTLLPRAIVENAVREGRVRLHELPIREGRVETLFIHRRDSYVSSALMTFRQTVSPLADAAE